MARFASFTFVTSVSQEAIQEFIENQEFLTVEEDFRRLENGDLEVHIVDHWGDHPQNLLVLQQRMLQLF
jgi:hypothetical protein